MVKNQEIHSLYFHFPYCVHLCNYCDFYKHKLIKGDTQSLMHFNSLVKLNIALNKNFLKQNNFSMNKLDTLYFGGGTPSLWSQNGIDFVRNNFFELNEISFNKNYEFTMEVDPGTINYNELLNWIKLGVNRFSIGVQSFNNEILDSLDRVHKKEQIIETLKMFQDLKLNYSVDLMIGAPKLNKTSKRDVLKEIEDLITFGPNHFSVYILSTRLNYPLKNFLPNDELTSEEYLSVCEFLNNNNFLQYEVSNFAKDGFKSKHNLAYWNFDSVASLGPVGTGLLVQNNSAIRYQWNSKLDQTKIEILDDKAMAMERLYLFLRCNRGINTTKDLALLKLSKDALKEFDRWIEQGVASYMNNGRLQLNSKGYLILDFLIESLFKYQSF